MDAGVELMGVGDPASSLVGPVIFSEFIVPVQKKLVEGLKAMGLRTRSHMCGNTKRILKARGELGYDITDVDAMVPLAEARAKMPEQVILGNIATVEVLRNGSVENVIAAVKKCSEDAGEQYIIGAGCEVPRDTPVANMFALRDYAHAHLPRPAVGAS
jgi:uroporphyrinogen-III decarboxylase